ncbi:MAG: clostripain-related cysteine peptidase [bacterium]
MITPSITNNINTIANNQITFRSAIQNQEIQDQKPEKQENKKDWTVFLYVNTEDHASVKNLMLNLKLLEMVGSDKNINIVVQAYLPTWKKVKRFYIEKKEDWETDKIIKLILSSLLPWKKIELENKPIEEIENVDIKDPKFFEESLKWVIKNYPSDKLMVMTIGDNEGIKKSSSQLNIKDLAQSMQNVYLETKVKPDILVMDGSAVSSIETITELKDKADYLVGTSGFAPSLNIPIAIFLNEMKGIIDGGPNDVQSVLKTYFLMHNLAGASNQVSAIDLTNKKIDEFIKAWDEMSKELLKLDEETLVNKVLPLMYKAEDLANTPNRKPYIELRDAISFAKLLSSSKDLPDTLKQTAQKVVDLHPLVVHMENNLYKEQLDPDSNGLSVFMPFNFGNFKSEKFPIPKGFKKDYGYSELLFSKLTHWDEFLTKISRKDIFERFLTKLGLPQKVIDQMYALKNQAYNTYKEEISGWARIMGWINAVNRISSDKPVGFLFLPPSVALILGIINSIEQIYESLKAVKYVRENIPEKSIIGNLLLDASQGVSKLIANLSYKLPFLTPVAPAAGLFTFLLPWIKDLYNVYLNYKKNKEEFTYSDITLSEAIKNYYLNKLAQTLT